MRHVIFLCIVVFPSISGLSQNIYTSDNITMEKIAEMEFRYAYQNKRKSVYMWKNGDWIIKHSGITRKVYAHEEFSETDLSNMRFIKIKSKSYLLQEAKPVLSETYYMKGETIDRTAMFGIGDIDNDQIYYASPDYDCDQHLWCRWYSFTDGKVSILAELEDKSFEYDLANYDLPSFFADNRGYYYIVINKNPNIYDNIEEKTFYKIKLKF